MNVDIASLKYTDQLNEDSLPILRITIQNTDFCALVFT